MKILMLNYEFPPIGGGGGQAHRALLDRYANRADLDVEVLTSAPTPGVFQEEPASNVTIRRVGIRKKDLHYWRRVEVVAWLAKAGPICRRLLQTGRFDLIHAFFGFPTGWLCYRSAGRTPYLISLRGSDVPGENARLKLEYAVLGPLVFKPIWRRAAALVACSEGLRTRALRFMPSAQIEVIPNGVDLETFHPSAGARPAGALRLLTVGRLSVTKRLSVLIEAVDLLRRNSDVRLTIVGGGSLEASLRQLLAGRDLRGAVTLAGWRTDGDMPEVYREHDVFVSASMQEGMSNAMLEAMASGLPIVTTRCEGVDELIADNGLIVEGAEAEGLARAIATLDADGDLRRRMAGAARRRAEKFQWESVASGYLEVYRKVKA